MDLLCKSVYILDPPNRNAASKPEIDIQVLKQPRYHELPLWLLLLLFYFLSPFAASAFGPDGRMMDKEWKKICILAV
jgi:hypothetical protein